MRDVGLVHVHAGLMLSGISTRMGRHRFFMLVFLFRSKSCTTQQRNGWYYFMRISFIGDQNVRTPDKQMQV